MNCNAAMRYGCIALARYDARAVARADAKMHLDSCSIEAMVVWCLGSVLRSNELVLPVIGLACEWQHG